MKTLDNFTYENIVFLNGNRYVVFDDETLEVVSHDDRVSMLLGPQMILRRKRSKISMAKVVKSLRLCLECGKLLPLVYSGRKSSFKVLCGKRECFLSRKRKREKTAYLSHKKTC